MTSVWQCANSLVEGIIQSEEYKSYSEAKEALKGNVELCVKLNEFRERNFKLQSSTEDIDLFDELDLLEREYADILRDAKVSTFLATESRICRIVREINATIAKKIDLELEF